jgi:hypothetical protein
MKKILLFFILTQFCFSQKSAIKGKIISESTNLEGIHVINKTLNKGVVTTSGGYFTIQANEKDTLIFSAVYLEAVNHIVKKEDFSEDLLFIKIKALVSTLEEVTMTKYKNITAEALGIIPKGIKTFTPAERRLAAAGEFKWYSPLLIPLGGMSVDGLINAISGRKDMLKKNLEVERKEFFMEDVLLTYGTTFFTIQLKIPEENLRGFLFYIAEDKAFKEFYKVHTKSMVEFELAKLAQNYLALIKETN